METKQHRFRNNRHQEDNNMIEMKMTDRKPKIGFLIQRSNYDRHYFLGLFLQRAKHSMNTSICNLTGSKSDNWKYSKISFKNSIENFHSPVVFQRSLCNNCFVWRYVIVLCDHIQVPLVYNDSFHVGNGIVRTLDSIWTVHNGTYTNGHHES